MILRSRSSLGQTITLVCLSLFMPTIRAAWEDKDGGGREGGGGGVRAEKERGRDRKRERETDRQTDRQTDCVTTSYMVQALKLS